MIVVLCAQKMKLSQEVMDILKKHPCSICDRQFADKVSMAAHEATHKSQRQSGLKQVKKNPKHMNINELKQELQSRNLSTAGRKDLLVRRLEGVLTDEI